MGFNFAWVRRELGLFVRSRSEESDKGFFKYLRPSLKPFERIPSLESRWVFLAS